MKIIICIPAYNEEKTIASVIKEIKTCMKKFNYSILVVNDGSTDRTSQIVKKHGVILVNHSRNLGLIETFKTGVKEALKRSADIIVITDADGQYPAIFIPKLINKLREDYDLVLGSRFKGRPYGMPLTKRLGNKLFAKVLSSITKFKLSDTTTGFRAFTKNVAKKIDFINTFTYTQEQILKALQLNFKIAEIPIITRKTRPSRLFSSIWEYAIKAWINLFRIYRDYKPLKFFGYIGILFFIIGFLFGLNLFYIFLNTGTLEGKTPTAVLSAIFMLIGIQVVLFGFLADMFKK